MKSTCLILRCPDNSRFHFGKTGINTTSVLLHSDTLFSALAHAYALAFGAAEPLIDFVLQRRLMLSSALPCLLNSQTGNYTYFLPLPAISFEQPPNLRESKAIKKLRFVSSNALVDIALNSVAADTTPRSLRTSRNLLSYPTIDSTFIYHESELPPGLNTSSFLSVHSVPKVQTHALSSANSLYHETFVHFTPITVDGNCSLSGHYYMLIHHDLDQKEWSRVLTALRIAADEGFGGERSTGAGQCRDVLTAELPPFPVIQQPSLYLTLSLLAPDSPEELAALSTYTTIVRGGGVVGIGTTARRLRVRMVEEGALSTQSLQGRLVDISPRFNPLPHPVYRNGTGFSIPIR